MQSKYRQSPSPIAPMHFCSERHSIICTLSRFCLSTMRKSRPGLAVFACIAAFSLPPLASAQPQSAPAAPPNLEKLEEGEAPAVTIESPQSNNRIVEKRERGQVTSIRVESGNSTYYVQPSTPASSAAYGGIHRNTTRAPQWQIFEFNWEREPDKSRETAAQAATIAPPPAPSAPSKNQ
jgi:hypothetical protein